MLGDTYLDSSCEGLHNRSEEDCFWTAVQILCALCRQYSNSVNCLQQRVTQLLVSCWQSDAVSFATHHGAVYALQELGMEVRTGGSEVFVRCIVF